MIANRHPPGEPELRQALVAACRRLAQLGLVGGAEGNVSVRLGPRRILGTPSGLNKAALEPHQLVVTDPGGRKIVGFGMPSSELPMHLAIYARRPDVNAVVHAHPATAIALTLAGISLEAPLMPEVVTALGDGIPTAPYETPSTPALALGVATTLGARDACLMERHGAVAIGANLALAVDRMETIERVAQVLLRTRLLGGCAAPLPREEIERLLALSGRTARASS